MFPLGLFLAGKMLDRFGLTTLSPIPVIPHTRHTPLADAKLMAAVFDSDGNQTAESKFKVKTLENLTLLSGNRNIRASNRSFDTKRATYSESDLLIVKDLGSKESWTLPEIQERQSELNRLACQAWPQ